MAGGGLGLGLIVSQVIFMIIIAGEVGNLAIFDEMISLLED